MKKFLQLASGILGTFFTLIFIFQVCFALITNSEIQPTTIGSLLLGYIFLIVAIP